VTDGRSSVSDASRLTESQRAATAWLRSEVETLSSVPLPGSGATLDRWRILAALGRRDLARARLAEGHLDALAILAELGSPSTRPGETWGVWAAEPTHLRAERDGCGWRLAGEKRWCSGADALDHALVSAVASDGARLFVVEPCRLELVPGSWPSIGMEATASMTMRFDVRVGTAATLGGPGEYVSRPGFWHGGAGVAACWFGGALGVAEQLRVGSADSEDDHVVAVLGRIRARLASAAALLERSAQEIDAGPDDVEGARRRALQLRLVVEDAASFVLSESVRALGAATLAFDRGYASRVADLQLYLRQLRREPVAAELGLLTTRDPVRW
jgi:alkylation response protein AidB-like acyl-CoA dehydrogenase